MREWVKVRETRLIWVRKGGTPTKSWKCERISGRQREKTRKDQGELGNGWSKRDLVIGKKGFYYQSFDWRRNSQGSKWIDLKTTFRWKREERTGRDNVDWSTVQERERRERGGRQITHSGNAPCQRVVVVKTTQVSALEQIRDWNKMGGANPLIPIHKGGNLPQSSDEGWPFSSFHSPPPSLPPSPIQ